MFILKYCTCAWWSIGGSPIWVGQYTLGTWASVVRKRFSLANCSRLLNVGTECSRKVKEDWCCMYSYRLAVWKMMIHFIQHRMGSHNYNTDCTTLLPLSHPMCPSRLNSPVGYIYFYKIMYLYFLQQFAVNCNFKCILLTCKTHIKKYF